MDVNGGTRIATLGIDVELTKGDASVRQLREIGTIGEQAGRQAAFGIGAISPVLERMTVLAAQVFATRRIIEYSDSYAGLHARLSLVTKDVADLTRVENELFQSSQRTRTSFEANVNLFSSLERSTKSLGLGQRDILTITDAVAKSFVVSGASASETSNAIRQLSQAFASGVLRGDEFNSMAENAPRLQQALAQSLGVTIGQLRQMAAEGKLTSQVMATGILGGAKSINEEFAKMPTTIGQSFTYFENALVRFVGGESNASGASNALASSIKLVADNIRLLVTAGEAAIAIYGARWLAEATKSAGAFVAQITLARAETAAYSEMSVRAATATAGQAQATLLATQARRVELVEMQRQIASERELAVARVQAAEARLSGAVSPGSLAPLGGAAVARELAAQNAAQRERTLGLIAGNAAASQATVINTELAATEALEARQAQLAAAAEAERAVAMKAAAVSASGAAATTGVLARGMQLLAGPIGAVILAATVLASQLDNIQKLASRVLYGDASQTDAQNAATEKALEQERARNAAIKQTVETASRAQQAAAATIAQRQEELGKMTALNAAYGQSDLALKEIAIRYDANIERIKNAVGHTKEQTAALNALTDALMQQRLVEAENAAGVGELRSKTAELNASLPALQSGFDGLRPSMMAVNELWQDQLHNVKLLKDAYSDIIKDIRHIGDENARIARQQVNEAADAIKQSDKYSADLQKIWRDGISKITTDGFKSFLDFAEDLNRLFTRVMDRMAERARQLGKEAGGAGYTALGIGVAAISGGVAGYQSGDPGVGILGGALAGSAFGAPGILVGALAGLTGALFGGAKAARERKEAEDQLRESYNQSIAQIRNQLGDISDLDYAKLQTSTQFDALRKAAADLQNPIFKTFGITTSSMKDRLAQINDLEQRRLKQLEDEAAATKAAAIEAERLSNANAQNNYRLRIFNANGDSDAAFGLQQQIELEQAIRDGLNDSTIALLQQAQRAEKEQREREKQTQILQDQLSTAQQQLDSLKQVYENLSAFRSSLSIGQYSPLSPRQQLDAVRAQLNAVYQKGLGGDVNAAGQFSGVAQQFLESSRRYNASGAGYVLDFNSVSVMTDALQKAFGNRISDAQNQVNLLTSQLAALKDVKQGIIDLGTTLIMVNTQLGTLQQGLALATVEEIADVGETIERTSRDIVRELEAVKSVASR